MVEMEDVPVVVAVAAVWHLWRRYWERQQ